MPSRLENRVARRRGTVFPTLAWRPHELSETAPATVLVMNPVYRDEVECRVADLGLPASVVVA